MPVRKDVAREDIEGRLDYSPGCPHCGSYNLRIIERDKGRSVECGKCSALGPFSSNPDGVSFDAIDLWLERHRQICEMCGCDGGLTRPYPGDCPENHLGKGTMMRVIFDEMRKVLLKNRKRR